MLGPGRGSRPPESPHCLGSDRLRPRSGLDFTTPLHSAPDVCVSACSQIRLNLKLPGNAQRVVGNGVGLLAGFSGWIWFLLVRCWPLTLQSGGERPVAARVPVCPRPVSSLFWSVRPTSRRLVGGPSDGGRVERAGVGLAAASYFSSRPNF
jgi:hypothetical protein